MFGVNVVNYDPYGMWTSLKIVFHEALTITNFLKVNGVNRKQFKQPNNSLSIKQ
jgi:hypothetical protein